MLSFRLCYRSTICRSPASGVFIPRPFSGALFLGPTGGVPSSGDEPLPLYKSWMRPLQIRLQVSEGYTLLTQNQQLLLSLSFCLTSLLSVTPCPARSPRENCWDNRRRFCRSGAPPVAQTNSVALKITDSTGSLNGNSSGGGPL